MSKVTNLLDRLSPEDIEKIREHQKGSLNEVSEEVRLIGEFAAEYGYDAYVSALEDKMSFNEMMMLIEAKRRSHHARMYRDAQAMFVACASAQSKSPSKTFRSLTKEILKRM